MCLGRDRRRGAVGIWILVSMGVDRIHGAAPHTERRARVDGERAERLLRLVCRHAVRFPPDCSLTSSDIAAAFRMAIAAVGAAAIAGRFVFTAKHAEPTHAEAVSAVVP